MSAAVGSCIDDPIVAASERQLKAIFGHNDRRLHKVARVESEISHNFRPTKDLRLDSKCQRAHKLLRNQLESQESRENCSKNLSECIVDASPSSCTAFRDLCVNENFCIATRGWKCLFCLGAAEICANRFNAAEVRTSLARNANVRLQNY